MRRPHALSPHCWSLLLAVICSLLVMPLASVSAAPGDRDEPVELGETGTYGDWEIVVDDYEADATDDVVGSLGYNADPDKGNVYALGSFTITNTGSTPLDPAMELTIGVVGESLVGSGGFTGWCYLENDLYVVGELDEDESAEFQLCWQVSEEDAESLVLNVTGFFSSEEDPLWMSLGNDFTVPTEAPEIATDVITESTEDDTVPMGETGQVGDLLLTVDAIKADAYDQLKGFDSTFEAPATGDTYVLVRMTAMYVGDDVGGVAGNISLSAIDGSGETYDTWDNGCGGYVPNDEYSVSTLYPGGQGSFNFCIAVPADELDGLALVASSTIDFDTPAMYFALADN